MPQAYLDKLTDADRKALARPQDMERARTSRNFQQGEDIFQVSQERREVYTWSAPEYGEIVFDIRGIKDGILAGEFDFVVMRCDLDPDWVEHIRNNNGIEPERLARISNLERPGIAIVFPGNEGVSLIDGNHCAVRCAELGKKTFRFVLVRLGDVKRYTCKPGEERELFARSAKLDPNMTLLHTEIRKV